MADILKTYYIKMIEGNDNTLPEKKENDVLYYNTQYGTLTLGTTELYANEEDFVSVLNNIITNQKALIE